MLQCLSPPASRFAASDPLGLGRRVAALRCSDRCRPRVADGVVSSVEQEREPAARRRCPRLPALRSRREQPAGSAPRLILAAAADRGAIDRSSVKCSAARRCAVPSDTVTSNTCRPPVFSSAAIARRGESTAMYPSSSRADASEIAAARRYPAKPWRAGRGHQHRPGRHSPCRVRWREYMVRVVQRH